MAAAYSFVSRWDVPASAARCWDEIERMLRPDGSVDWWPGVGLAQAPAHLRAGEHLIVEVRSPLGYRLRARLTLTDIEPGRRIAAASAGDLVGRGELVIAEQGAGEASLIFLWDVSTAPRWMNATAWLLRPAFARAHAVVMRRGEAGLRRALAE